MQVSQEWDPIEGGIEPFEPTKWFRDPPRLPSGIIEYAYVAASRPLTNGAWASTWTDPMAAHREHHSSPTEGGVASPTPPLNEKDE